MAAGDPTGEDLCSGTTDGDTLSEYGDWTEREITLGAGTELTEGVKYAIIVGAADVVGEAELYWSTRIDNPYGDGDRYASSDSGDSWTIDEDDDVWFKTKTNGVEKDDGSFEEDAFNRADDAHGATWVAQTFTAGSTYTITSVILKLAKMTTWGGTVETVTVGIRATVGAPEQATILLPTDGADDVTLDQATITWEDGGNADTYDVYYGDNAAAVAAADTTDETGIYLGNQAAESFTITDITFGSPFDYLITRYWRIDAVNDAGTTAGDVWSFISIAFDQLRISYVLITGGSGAGPYDDPAGVEGTDWSWTGLNNMMSVRRLVVAANSKIYYESI